MIERNDRARLNAQGAQAKSRAANIRLHTATILAASRRCLESSELLLAVDPRSAGQR